MSERYVIDPSALIQACVREPQTDHLLSLLDQVPDAIELHIPEFCLVECANILWKHVCLHGMPGEVAKQAVRTLLELVLAVHAAPVYLQEALDVGLDYGLVIYDALYIALAQKLRIPLITADEKQARIAEQIGVTVKPITDFAPAK